MQDKTYYLERIDRVIDLCEEYIRVLEEHDKKSARYDSQFAYGIKLATTMLRCFVEGLKYRLEELRKEVEAGEIKDDLDKALREIELGLRRLIRGAKKALKLYPPQLTIHINEW